MAILLKIPKTILQTFKMKKQTFKQTGAHQDKKTTKKKREIQTFIILNITRSLSFQISSFDYTLML